MFLLALFTTSLFWLKSLALTDSSQQNVVTLYLLIDTVEQLQRYVDDLNQVDKVNFNRVIFSFVKPTLTNYVSGDLSNTGIMGYFENGDGNISLCS
jgi:hypothetical protein